RYAMRAAKLALVSIAIGQAVDAIWNKPYLNLLYAAFTLVIAVAFYWSAYRNLTRNLSVARGATAAWAAVGACFVLNNIANGNRLLALADAIATACVLLALVQLWRSPKTPNGAAVPGVSSQPTL